MIVTGTRSVRELFRALRALLVGLIVTVIVSAPGAVTKAVP